MKQNLKEYLTLSAAIFKFRADNPNSKTDPDEILDAMDPLWYDMSWYEKRWAESEIKRAMKSKDEEIKFIDKYL